MSQIRIAVIGADHLDPDHHIALNTLSESGHVSAFALDADPSDAGFETLRTAMQGDALDAVIVAGSRAHLTDWLKFSVQQGWPVYSTLPVPDSIEEMVENGAPPSIGLNGAGQSRVRRIRPVGNDARRLRRRRSRARSPDHV